MDNCTNDNIHQIEAYLRILSSQRQLSDYTIVHYKHDLLELNQLCQKPLHTITPNDIRRNIAQLRTKNLNARSIARKLSAWRGLFQYLLEQNQITNNPTDDIHAPKKSKPLPKALSVDDAVFLVSHEAQTSSKTDKTTLLCNRALFELLYSCGLRVSELVSLDIYAVKTQNYTSVSWINLDDKELTVTGKGNKTRIVPIGEMALKALKSWLGAREKLIQQQTLDEHRYALFINSQGRRLSQRLIQYRIKAHAQALGLTTSVHPHVMRHSFASHLLQSSGDLRAVQELLGHSSIVSTQVYTKLDFQRLAEVYDKTHPRAKLKKPKTA